MKHRFWVALVLARMTFGAIDGTVVNKSNGQPAANVSVTLVKPGQGGMRTLGTTVTDASGHFTFAKDEPAGGPQLLQAAFGGVNYNKLLTPVSPTSGVELDVFDVTKAPSVVQAVQQFMVLEPDTSKITVDESVIFQNQSTQTFNNEQTGAFRFYLPRAANGQVRVSVQGPQGMPLPRAAEKTDQADVFKINYPIKPGETQIEINYVIPAGSPFTLRGRVVDMKGLNVGPLRLIAPSGVTLTSPDVQNIGVEPKTQATIYNVKGPAYTVEISGTGSLRPPESTDSSAPAQGSDSPAITQGTPQIYQHLPWLVGAALSILAVGLVVLYRSSPVRAPYGN